MHGLWTGFSTLLNREKPEACVQVGDFGWGFHGQDSPKMQRSVAQVEASMTKWNVRYIRGNHDNPGMCREHSFCIPDGTYDEATGIFYVGGALSIDRARRTLGIDYWDDEELSYDALFDLIDVYEKVKPRIVISHECPESIIGHMMDFYKQDFHSRTRQALDSMFAIHQPEQWIFGHWHNDVTYEKDGTVFRCLNELSCMEIDI